MIEPRVEITLNAPQAAGGLQLSATVSRREGLDSIPEMLIVQMALVEKLATSPSNGLTYRHIVRKLIPDAAGAARLSWSDLDALVEQTWQPTVDISPGDFFVLVFVQGEDSKEIYQAAMADINFALQATEAGLRAAELTPDEVNNQQVHIYPNPTSGDISIYFERELAQEMPWQLWDAQGIQHGQGWVPKAGQEIHIPTWAYPAGMYILQIGQARKPVIIVR
ncbi:MAG: T9SS type A sorting domain-containing protein [Bacteroidia bacterium]|nr:T9SS type A sorting domain-containing protein [Bacteroidia bacterium]